MPLEDPSLDKAVRPEKNVEDVEESGDVGVWLMPEWFSSEDESESDDGSQIVAMRCSSQPSTSSCSGEATTAVLVRLHGFFEGMCGSTTKGSWRSVPSSVGS